MVDGWGLDCKDWWMMLTINLRLEARDDDSSRDEVEPRVGRVERDRMRR